ncbi:MAG TPA: YigZ family protein [Candidatus Krumholzibacteria bacterium]|nr:YigZ family protein [Candidatus Krumholzibacteria bacterium]
MARATRYPVPAAPVRVEDRVHNSRFLATLAPAATTNAAHALIDAVRAEFPDATHHCFAFVAGPPGSTAAIGSGDDGEPAGTAGRPMLSVLLNSGMGDVAAVVTRWFGGVKLGKGGLVRAYSGAVQHALRVCATSLRVELVDARVAFAYAHSDAVRRALAREDAVIVGESFGDEVVLAVRLPADRLDEIARVLADATSGAARIERAE